MLFHHWGHRSFVAMDSVSMVIHKYPEALLGHSKVGLQLFLYI